MSDLHFIAQAAAGVPEIVRRVEPADLGAPTPCAEYDVRKLINHLLFWGPSLEGAARKASVPPPAASEGEVDLTAGDWPAALAAQIERLVAAWSEPAAWEGTTFMGGATELPASMVGGMVAGELVVHGWDLARATGQHPEWDDDLLERLAGEVAKSAEQGRRMGVYGPEVPVPDDAPPLDRVLALTGRDPSWKPGA
ncbi:TIGR03086 family metal-binding protein [Nonomuraea sp. SBT364]|uniref:TIGR03086 family metal-binding protein n=1 Tax=Nonomuraea sp. SBT364 TaxID=1580530 RepID=UPI0009E77E79|nr:TIGR03086 family metal-binding protein [Nonomuraea sp. SBT364]